MEKVTDKEYRCAYKEVIIILNVIDYRLKKLIPKDKIDFYLDNLDESHNFEYDYSKTINEQNILYATKCIIANLFRDYIATEKDKAEIVKRENEELRQLEEEKKKIYSVDNIFTKNIDSQNVEKYGMSNSVNSSKDLITNSDKKDFFEIIKQKIRSFINVIKGKM